MSIAVRSFAIAALTLSTALSAQDRPAIRSAPPPPARFVPPPMGNQQQFVEWRSGEAQCGGIAQTPVHFEPPMGALGWGSTTGRVAVTFGFRLDADGRPLGIEKSGTAYVSESDDLAPALSVSRFAPGAARGGCTITYSAVRTPIAQASIEALTALTLFPGGVSNRAVWDRVMPGDTSCTQPVPAVLLRAFPDFKALPQGPGEMRWSMVGFDLSPAGKPVKVRTVGGTKSAALDRAALRAVAASRFEKGARRGCRYPYWQRGTPVVLPESIDRDAFQAAATCPNGATWAQQPVLRYPDTYRRRSIEGWAAIGFDVAPWGATGNIHVLAAEPSADFGVAAMEIIRQASKAPSATGYTGCVERVRYVISDRLPPAGTTDIPPPAPF